MERREVGQKDRGDVERDGDKDRDRLKWTEGGGGESLRWREER
jgi:hypothetical protein